MAIHLAVALALCFGSAAAQFYRDVCDITVQGFGPGKFNLNGQWMFKNGYYGNGDNRARYEMYYPMPKKEISLEWNMEKKVYKKYTGEDAWLITASDNPYENGDSQILARCKSPACLNTTDIFTLPAGEPWEVPSGKCTCGDEQCDLSACSFKANPAAVSIGCCTVRPEISKCGAWTEEKCAAQCGWLGCGSCEKSGCCTLYHQHLSMKCLPRYFPHGTRCAADGPLAATPELAATASNIVV